MMGRGWAVEEAKQTRKREQKWWLPICILLIKTAQTLITLCLHSTYDSTNPRIRIDFSAIRYAVSDLLLAPSLIKDLTA